MVAEFLLEVWYGNYLRSCGVGVWRVKVNTTSSFIIIGYKLVYYRVLW